MEFGQFYVKPCAQLAQLAQHGMVGGKCASKIYIFMENQLILSEKVATRALKKI